MSDTISALEKSTLGLHCLEHYEPLIGAAAADRIRKKADALRSLHVVHVSSTFDGGGVTELLTPLTLMMNAMGIETGWRMLQGTPGFFASTKKLHNALQGERTDLSDAEKAVYEQVVFENSIRLHIEDCDAVIVHDPQPLPLVNHFVGRDMPWIWQCHVDLSAPDLAVWNYLRSFVEGYDAAVFSLPEYAQELALDQRFIPPAIDPFSAKNREMSDAEIANCLAHYGVPTDRPLVVQVSRFDRWKDPFGVIEAFRRAREEVDCTLVLAGNNAVDDPEGGLLLDSIQGSIDDGIFVITADDATLVNALQRSADVVLQKSTREGFGLTVTEAMWKGAAVIGGNVGGIRRQIKDGENGFLVDSIGQAAERIVQIVKDSCLRKRIGTQARETVREKYLMSRLVEDWLDVLAAFNEQHAVATT
jgi:trehalose synthase